MARMPTQSRRWTPPAERLAGDSILKAREKMYQQQKDGDSAVAKATHLALETKAELEAQKRTTSDQAWLQSKIDKVEALLKKIIEETKMIPHVSGGGGRKTLQRLLYKYWIVDNDDLSVSGEKLSLRKNVYNWVLGQIRIKLSAALTLYVDVDNGNDTTGTGAVGAPFQTVNTALQWVQRRYDLGAFNLTLQCVSPASGSTTYAAINFAGSFVSSGGRVVIKGDSSDRSKVKFYSASGIAAFFSRGADVILDYCSFDSPASQCVAATLGAKVRVENTCRVYRAGSSPTTDAHFYASRFGYIELQGGYQIYGSAGAHLNSTHAGNIRLQGTNTPATDKITVTGSCGFVYFVFVESSASEIVITNMGTGGSSYFGTLTPDGTYPCAIGRIEAGTVQYATGLQFPEWPPGCVAETLVLTLGGKFNNGLSPPAEFFSYSTDAATNGPDIFTVRAGNPDASKLTRLLVQGDNSAAESVFYGIDAWNVESWTDGAESAERKFQLLRSGSITNVMQLGNGMVVGTPTGSFKGLGTANFSGDVYKNNTAFTNPDYVFENFYRGQIVEFADKDGAAEYEGLVPLDSLREHTRETLRLPGMTDNPMGMFERGDKLLEKVEEMTLYILELHERLKAVESTKL